jgi:hypothetical protein
METMPKKIPILYAAAFAVSVMPAAVRLSLSLCNSENSALHEYMRTVFAYARPILFVAALVVGFELLRYLGACFSKLRFSAKGIATAVFIAILQCVIFSAMLCNTVYALFLEWIYIGGHF